MYQLPNDETAELKARSETWARDRAELANQFNAGLIENYRSMYDNFWSVGRDDIGLDVINAGLKRLGPVGIKILADAGMYIVALSQLIGESFPPNLLTPPRKYVIKDVVFQDGFESEYVSDFVALFGLVQQHGYWVSGYVEAGDLLND
jgi:hypothetical protein